MANYAIGRKHQRRSIGRSRDPPPTMRVRYDPRKQALTKWVTESSVVRRGRRQTADIGRGSLRPCRQQAGKPPAPRRPPHAEKCTFGWLFSRESSSCGIVRDELARAVWRTLPAIVTGSIVTVRWRLKNCKERQVRLIKVVTMVASKNWERGKISTWPELRGVRGPWSKYWAVVVVVSGAVWGSGVGGVCVCGGCQGYFLTQS